MLVLMEIWESIRDFVGTGGQVLYVVAIALFLMWVLMIERYWFLLAEFPRLTKDIVAKWDARQDTTSWYAHRIREAWISEASEKLDQRMLLIKTLVAICPLIGLLGTVTGNARLMASGISMATIPTMAGMVAALSGVFFSSRLEARARMVKAKLVDSMPHH